MSEDKYKGRDIDTWPTKKEVAARLGRSEAAVVRLQTKGRLNPVEDEEGINRYPPEEVDAVCQDPPQTSLMKARSREEDDDYKYGFARDVLNLVRDPREKIDALLFKMIDRLTEENTRLKKQLDDQTLEIERARDRAAERTLELNSGMSSLRVQELAKMRLIETVSRLLTGGKEGGVTLSPAQLEELLTVGDFFTDEQKRKAQATIVASKTTQVVKDVADVVAKKDEQKEGAPAGG